MKLVSSLLIAALMATPAFAGDPNAPIRASAEKAAAAAAAAQTDGKKPPLFWTGLAVGLAGVTTAVMAVSVARVESRSTGNAPASTFQSCEALKSDPIYASSECN